MFIPRKAASNPPAHRRDVTAPTRVRSSGRARAGFTLLEVLAAMALITFVIGGVYGISGSAVELGRSMNEARIIETRVTNFVSVWRDYFETMTPEIRFSAGVEKTAHGGPGAILIEGGAMPFAWHSLLRQAEAVEFSVQEGQNGQSLMVRHLRKPERPKQPGEYEVLAQMPLLEGLEKMHWQFYEPVDDEWFGNWDPKKRPEAPLFMRLTFQLLEDPRQHEHVFWLANDLAHRRVEEGAKR